MDLTQTIQTVFAVLKKELTEGRDAVIGKYLSNGLADNESRHAAGQGFAYNKLLNITLDMEKQIFGTNAAVPTGAPSNTNNTASVSIPMSDEPTPVEGTVVN